MGWLFKWGAVHRTASLCIQALEHFMINRTKAIEKASLVGVFGNAALAVLKIVLGVFSGSLALIGAGIDTATDIITSLITLFAARLAAKPPDREHPYGHGRAETIATKLLSFIIFFAGAQLALTTGKSFFSGTSAVLPDSIALYATAISIIGKTALFFYKRAVAMKVDSLMLMADAKNMLGDIFLSVSVFIGLGATLLVGVAVVDRIMAAVVSLWIMRTAFSIFLESTEELMEGTPDENVYREIFQAVSDTPGAGHPHRTRVRKLNGLKVIDLDIEVDGQLSVVQGHRIAMAVENAIKEKVEKVYDIIVHIEPKGNWESAERYGLSEKQLNDPNESGTK